MKKKLFLLLIVLFLTTGVLPGCAREHGLDPDNPVTLALWHNYGGQMQKTMDALVDEFNNTVGNEKGVVLNVTSISSSASLHEKLTMAASGDPGAPALPDITTCYPKTALTLAGKDKLVNLDSQFTGKELAAYLPRFIEEGRLEDKDGGLYVFPIAKSTEVLFVNQTLFDRFSQATGVTVACFDTPEGIADAAVKYRDWTDSQTPDTPGDGKAFYTSDAPFNYAQIGMAQQGEGLIEKESLNLDNAAFKKIWDSYYAPSVKGGFAIFDGYSSDLSKTGEIICSTGSTAGILFYGDTITYPDSRTENVEYTVLPYPVFENGQKIAMQRGSGMAVTSSTPEREYAAGLFLKWFTAPEQNIQFVSSTGYLPVTEAAFGTAMNEEMETVTNPNVKKLLAAAMTMQQDYDFYIPPTFGTFDEMGSDFEADLKRAATDARARYLEGLKTMTPEAAYAQATAGDYEAFVSGR